jgi:hypothetical protein
MTTKKKIHDLEDLIDEIKNEVDREIESERIKNLRPEDRVLPKIASEILKLERDMTTPGKAVQDATRIERLAKFIEEAKF